MSKNDERARGYLKGIFIVMFEVAKRVAINFNLGVSVTKIAVFSALLPATHFFPLFIVDMQTDPDTHTHTLHLSLRTKLLQEQKSCFASLLLSRIDHYLYNSKLYLRVKLSGVFFSSLLRN